MSALQTPEKTSRRQELRDDSIVDLFARLMLFYEENKTLVYGLVAGLVALILAIPGYMYYQQQRAEEANQLLGEILPAYEQGRYQEALDGTADAQGLVALADDYGSTRAGNLATYYAGDAHYQMGNYDQALQFFEQFDKEEDFIGASAFAAEAAIYENRDEFETAAERYRQAATHYPNQLTTPRYLLRAGRAYEAAGEYDAAADMYTRIQEEYPDAPQATDAERYLARVHAMQEAATS
jgi:tetratricopeptide (TPR) repeat protein